MKQFLHSYRLFLIVAALCTLSAFWLLGVRIGVEQTQRQVDVVVSYEDVCALSDASGIPVQDWLTQLADAGARELLVTPEELTDPDIVRAAQDAGLGTAQAGGLAQGGTYFFAARYDTLAAAGQTGIDTDTEPLAQAQVLDALRESGSTLVLIEDRNQTGCVLPDGYSLDGYTGSMVKGFWLNQTFRARYQTLGYSGAEEIVNMLYRAVVDRGMTVLWLTPLTDAAGETVAQPEVYTQLLQDLAQRIAPAGYSYGGITGIPAKTVSPVLLMLCGIGVFAAAIVLLGVFVSLRARWLRVLLFALGCAESVGGTLLAPALQSTALALLAAIVFPCLAVAVLAAMLRESVQTRPGIGRYIGMTALGTAITFWGCCYIGAILSGSEYLLVLRLFRGVKLSQLAVYAGGMLLLAMALLHTRGCTLREDLETLRQENSRHWRRKLLCLLVILAAVGTVYILRTGDGMLSVSVGEQRARNWLERVLLFRPRTKEFLIAYPAIAAAYCCAAHRSRLTAWLFGVFGAIGFASVANTFCHIRAHFLVSLLRTGIGLVLGLVLGAIVLLILRACWPIPSGSTQTKE